MGGNGVAGKTCVHVVPSKVHVSLLLMVDEPFRTVSPPNTTSLGTSAPEELEPEELEPEELDPEELEPDEGEPEELLPDGLLPEDDDPLDGPPDEASPDDDPFPPLEEPFDEDANPSPVMCPPSGALSIGGRSPMPSTAPHPYSSANPRRMLAPCGINLSSNEGSSLRGLLDIAALELGGPATVPPSRRVSNRVRV
jgi:hypothetical protein